MRKFRNGFAALLVLALLTLAVISPAVAQAPSTDVNPSVISESDITSATHDGDKAGCSGGY